MKAFVQVLRMRLPEDSLDQAPREQYQGVIPAEPRTVPSVRESQSDMRNHDQNYPPAPSVAAVRSHEAMGAVMSPPPPQVYYTLHAPLSCEHYLTQFLTF